MQQLTKQTILGVGITNASKENILQYILTSLSEKRHPYYIVTPNPEILVFATSHKGYRTILNAAEIALADGVGVLIAGKLLGKPFQERVTGVDLLEAFCREVSKKPITVGFLGGRDGVAEKTAECLVSRYPELRVVFTAEEWGKDGFVQASKRSPQIRKQIDTDQRKSASNPRESIDILFVAYGFPKQEQWMEEHVGKIPVRVMMGVGGAFDYLSGRVPRAPGLIRSIGFEWFYRLIREPWRWRRQLALFKFAFLVLRSRPPFFAGK